MRGVPPHAAARLARARDAALARHMQRQHQPARLPEWLGRWLTAHNAAARRSAWAMAMVTALSVGYLGWTEWSAPSDADVDIALLTSDLPVEAYLHPNFTRDL